MVEIAARTSISQPPEWALLQRSLFDLLADAVDRFVDQYFEENGEPFWPPEDHVGCDGFDDVVEGFYNWPLVYAMGGPERVLSRARTVYEGALRRGQRMATPFGHPMVVEEFEHCRDWFHMGEGNQYTYNMGLAAPADDRVVERAERFAQLYFGESDTGNYDAEKRVVRGPMNGGAGPEHCDFSAYEHHPYGADYRWARHGLPWRDLEFDSAADLLDPDNEDRLFEVLNERCSKGDIPLNLNVTSLMTNAYLHTGEERYREWVLEYLTAWRERTGANGGIIPDNVGRSGEIGEYTDGSWYGGYYGWSWGGWHYVGIGPVVGAENAVLLTGDREHLLFPRSQLDTLIDEGVSVSDGEGHETLYIPHKHGGSGDYGYNASDVLIDDNGDVLWRDGWYEFRPHRDNPYAVHLWYMSMEDDDRERVRQLRDWGSQPWTSVDRTPATKHGAGEEYAWLAYLDGGFPDYPERLLSATHSRVYQRLGRMREEDELTPIDEDYLRDRNPVFHRGLLQLTMGAPQPVYYGGLVMAQVRHFDAERGRPGLPPDVAALVTDVSESGVGLTLLNTGGTPRELVVQAGAYGEHQFERIEHEETVVPESNTVRIVLPSATKLSLEAELDRFVNDPTYEIPVS